MTRSEHHADLKTGKINKTTYNSIWNFAIWVVAGTGTEYRYRKVSMEWYKIKISKYEFRLKLIKQLKKNINLRCNILDAKNIVTDYIAILQHYNSLWIFQICITRYLNALTIHCSRTIKLQKWFLHSFILETKWLQTFTSSKLYQVCYIYWCYCLLMLFLLKYLFNFFRLSLIFHYT